MTFISTVTLVGFFFFIKSLIQNRNCLASQTKMAGKTEGIEQTHFFLDWTTTTKECSVHMRGSFSDIFSAGWRRPDPKEVLPSCHLDLPQDLIVPRAHSCLMTVLSREVGPCTWVCLPYQSVFPNQSHLWCKSQGSCSFPSAMWPASGLTGGSKRLHQIRATSSSFWIIVWKWGAYLFNLLGGERFP